jgi:hypothetical protein
VKRGEWHPNDPAKTFLSEGLVLLTIITVGGATGCW